MNTIINFPDTHTYGDADFTCSLQRGGYFNNDGAIVEVPNTFFVVRDDNGTAFKPIGKDYQLVQHPDAFKTAERIIKQSTLKTEDMRRDFAISHDGARAFATYTFPLHRARVGLYDDIELQLLVRNSVDGSMRFCIEFGALRLACLNGMTALSGIGSFKRKHSKYLNIHDAVQKLPDAINIYKDSIENYKKFRLKTISDSDAITIIEDATATANHQKFIKSKLAEVDGHVDHLLWFSEMSRAYQLKDVWKEYKTYKRDLGPNLWALYNAMTGWATHFDGYKESSRNNLVAIQNDRRTSVHKTAEKMMLPLLEVA